MKTNANCTLYNQLANGTFQRTQIVGVLWENRKAANVIASGGEIAANQASIYIPFQRGANFLPSTEWKALSSKTGYWTLQTGDFIVNGLVSDEITAAVTNPQTHVVTPAFTVTSLKAKYNDVLSIKSIDFMNTGSLAMQHWQIGAG